MALPMADRWLTVEDLYSMPEDSLKYELQAGLLV